MRAACEPNLLHTDISWSDRLSKSDPKTSTKRTRPLKTSEKKWGRELWNAGWTGVPTIILRRQKALRLTPLDLNVLLHLISYWWDPARAPFPSKTTIAEALGKSPRTIQRSLNKMEGLGLVARNYREGLTTEYDLSGLKKKARPFAEEALEEKRRRIREAQRQARATAPRKEVA